jgi:hypothetical protein
MAEEDGVLSELEGIKDFFSLQLANCFVDQCTCWVCFEAFKDPITLLCLHSFCKVSRCFYVHTFIYSKQECTIKVYKRDAQCPFCR